jgi:putative endonuclease
MSFVVYILYSEKFDKHYSGYTSDLDSRIRSHNELGREWTARYRPWRIIYTKEFSEKGDAMRYEKWLKSGVGRMFIKTLPH